MEARERENARRVACGAKALRMPPEWTSRPRLNPAEQALFFEFLRFAQFCGGDPKPPDAIAWFEMRGVSRGEWSWLAEVFAGMAQAVRERLGYA